jgi:hypothetical protein
MSMGIVLRPATADRNNRRYREHQSNVLHHR